MESFDHKRIADPVHGTIGLSETETRLLATRAFQRLTHIRHLGLAHLVYPGANYSRLSHAIGTCHVAGRTLDALRARSSQEIGEAEYRTYRAAALVHDIGHYPLSHVFEDAVRTLYTSSLFESADTDAPEAGSATGSPELSTNTWYTHEQIAARILKCGRDIPEILEKAGMMPDDIISVIEGLGPYANLVSSDLDADRIDYLLRSSHHTGLPYGSVDIEYILSQLRAIESGDQMRICLDTRALRAADHFLLCRFFDYQQIVFHKTVVGLELVLMNSIVRLLRTGALRCSKRDIDCRIDSGSWFDFNDTEVLGHLQEYGAGSPDDVARDEAIAVLERRPPKMVYEHQRPRIHAEVPGFRSSAELAEREIERWSQRFSLDRRRWIPWKNVFPITSREDYRSSSGHSSEPDASEDRVRSMVWVSERGGPPVPIVEVPNSLTNILSQYEFCTFRVYVLFPTDWSDSEVKQRQEGIRSHLESELADRF